MSAMAEPINKTDDVRQVLKVATEPLTAHEIFERTELCEKTVDVHTRLNELRTHGEAKVIDRQGGANRWVWVKEAPDEDEAVPQESDTSQDPVPPSPRDEIPFRPDEFCASTRTWRDPDDVALTSTGCLQLRYGSVVHELSREATDRIAGFLGVFEDGIRRRLDDERSVPAPLTGLPVEGEQ